MREGSFELGGEGRRGRGAWSSGERGGEGRRGRRWRGVEEEEDARGVRSGRAGPARYFVLGLGPRPRGAVGVVQAVGVEFFFCFLFHIFYYFYSTFCLDYLIFCV